MVCQKGTHSKMETRKRKSSWEKYINGLNDLPEKRKKSTEFYNSLKMFYKRRWNVPLKLPNVQGVEVDLFKLYDTVMALGGWQKVANMDKWPDIAEMFGCKNDIVCGDHAIKLTYMRYLSKFEQIETVGDLDDYVDNEMSRSRGRNATSFFATNECPISNSRLQEYVRRDERGNILNEPDYGRLTKSLLSGLPNEVDFAMNICMLLSHAGPRQLRICHAPSLLTLLVAHTGIYDENDQTISELGSSWKISTNQDFESFWSVSGVNSDLLKRLIGSEVASRAEDEDSQFFTGLSASYNVKDPRSWRLNQVATVIRNLSFEQINRVTIVKTWPVMKFLILCASCQWAPLYTAAYDALSNLATDIDLTDRTLVHISHHALLKIIHEGIFSSDKFKLIRSLEMLTGLCAFEGNEKVICDWLSPEIINRILEVVQIKDIMMCVYTLECLYQISEMGDTACDMIADSPKAIQQLVSMSTLEAVAFGPAGLAGMKVVEYQPQFPNPQSAQHQQMLQQQQQQRMQNQQHQQQNSQNVAQQIPQPQSHHQNPQQIPPPQQQSHPTQQLPAHIPQMTVRQVIQSGLQHHVIQQHQAQAQQAKLGPAIPVQPIVPSTNSGDSQVEQLTEKWIKQNCVFEPTMSTPRGELYAAYVDDLRNQYYSLSGSLAMFSGVMKNLYPEVIFRMAENGVMIVAQGIRLVRPHKLAPAASTSSPEKSMELTHPLMKKMLSEKEPISNGVNGHSHVKTEEKYQNGLQVCKSPERFDENGYAKEELIAARKLNGSGDYKIETTSINGKLTNGYTKPQDNRKASSIASRAAELVAAVKMNGNIMNGIHEEKKENNEDGATTSTADENTMNSKNKKKVPTSSQITEYMCDWDCCSLHYSSPSHVLKHLSEEHVVEELRLLCRWNGCTDPTPRNRWSLITHIQDIHCNENQLKAAAKKRREGGASVRGIPRTEIVPRDISNHPGYAKNAAMDAIRRHAFNFLPREITDEAEGPVTKSIRLTSCLILRNLARYSSEGRQKLRRHESHLCWLALSRLESSVALSQLLAELHQTPVALDETIVKGLPEVASTASLSSITSTSNLIAPESPSSSNSTPTLQKSVNPNRESRESEESSTPSTSHRAINFSSVLPVSDMPPPSIPRHHAPPPSIQQHLPNQPSPLVTATTTPVRAAAAN
ncbi:unnamed protein product [Caenorhabditis angaria]|uniref:ARID domain-containing protein n=1 Tax=Caenorhabditis angaria TaxID=860376 RepID=A0A9P1IAM7_9PELO|nr:unnamed protein product [Caenorhabditis angaria]